MEEDEQDAERTDESDAEEVDAEEASTQGASIGEFLVNDALWHIPSQEETRQESSQGQEDLARGEIEQVEETHAEERDVAVVERQRAEHTYDGTQHSDDGGSATPRDLQLLMEECCAHLMQGDERRQCCHREQQVEQQRNDRSHERHGREGLTEHIGQGDEHQRGAGIGLSANGEDCREYHQACQDGDERVDADYLYGRFCQVRVTAEVAGIGAEASHAQAQRVEGLSQGSQQHVAVDFREVRTEQETDAFAGIGQQAGGDGNDDEQDEEQRHHQLRCLLDAFLHPSDDDEMGDEKEDQQVDDGLPRVRGEVVEVLLYCCWRPVKLSADGGYDIVQAPS